MSDNNNNSIKPGWKTTEFWLSVAAAVIGALYASGVVTEGSSLERVLGVIATVLAALGYSVSRGLAKR